MSRRRLKPGGHSNGFESASASTCSTKAYPSGLIRNSSSRPAENTTQWCLSTIASMPEPPGKGANFPGLATRRKRSPPITRSVSGPSAPAPGERSNQAKSMDDTAGPYLTIPGPISRALAWAGVTSSRLSHTSPVALSMTSIILALRWGTRLTSGTSAGISESRSKVSVVMGKFLTYPWITTGRY